MNIEEENIENDYLKDLAPKLMAFKDQIDQPDVPDGYFENFNKRLSKKIAEPIPKPKKGKVISLINYRNIAIAAALALILAALPFLRSYFVSSDQTSTEEILLSDEVLLNASETFILDEEFSDELLFESINQTGSTRELLSLSEEISDDDLTEYLIETEIDEYLIIEAL